MKKGLILPLLFFLLFLAGCNFKVACIGFGGEGLTNASFVNADDSCSPRLLVFPTENSELNGIFQSDNADYLVTEMLTFYVPEDTKAMFMDYNCFSEKELAEISSFSLIRDTGIGITRFSLPVYVTNMYYTALASSLFTMHDDYVSMKNPYSGEHVLLRGIDYVKFKGTPFIPVPPLENE